MIIVRALFGLKSSGVSWRSMFDNTLGKDGLGYTSIKTDKEIWIKGEFFTNGKTYYYMILVYVDDIMIVLNNTSIAINYLPKNHVFK